MPYADPEKEKEFQRRYREKNRKKLDAYQRQYREQNKEFLAEKTRRYGAANRKKLNAYRLEYRKTHPEKCHEWERKSHRQARENLSDGYVKSVLTVGTCLRKSDIPQPLVEAKREHLKLKRSMK